MCDLNNATHNTIINGMEASLVNSPSTMNRAQKNSANTTSNRETVPPNAKKIHEINFVFGKMNQFVVTVIHHQYTENKSHEKHGSIECTSRVVGRNEFFHCASLRFCKNIEILFINPLTGK
ncbi:MAG: hypothetical protein V9E88_11570 [Ferruginibacter sp.]